MSGWSAVDACAGPLCACACAQRRQRSGRCSPSPLPRREGPRTQVSAGHRRPVTRTLRPPAGEEMERGSLLSTVVDVPPQRFPGRDVRGAWAVTA